MLNMIIQLCETKESSGLSLLTDVVVNFSGNMGGRDSPRPSGGVPQADETWTTVSRGPKNVSVDPKRFQNIKVIITLNLVVLFVSHCSC